MSTKSATLIEYLADAYVLNGGEVDAQAEAEYFADCLYSALDFDDGRAVNMRTAQDEYMNVVNRFVDLIDSLMPAVEVEVKERGEE